jgi:hypothetical protein
MNLKWHTFNEVRIGDVSIPVDGVVRFRAPKVITIRFEVAQSDAASTREHIRRLREAAAPDPNDAA